MSQHKDWKKLLIPPETSVLKTIETLEATSLQIVMVVNSSHTLLGTVTDGDIRRGILRKLPFSAAVTEIMNANPITGIESDSKEKIHEVMRSKLLLQIPVLDKSGKVVGLEVIEQLAHAPLKENRVVLMAGGTGTRLRPMTDECPKPLLKVGDKPLLETILSNFVMFGFRKFYISVNYRAEMIEDYFKDGSKWGAEIQYLKEDTNLGTAGALSLIPNMLDLPFFVMNGDVLTKVNHARLLEFHEHHGQAATMCVRDFDYQVPYGVVSLDKERVSAIREKPIHRHFVNAGVYLFDPVALDFVKQGEALEMTILLNRLIQAKKSVRAFPISEYWKDIGRISDFEEAQDDFSIEFSPKEGSAEGNSESGSESGSND